MHTVNHRLDHFGESFGQALRRALTMLAARLGSSIDELAERNAARRLVEDDDIEWDDGEPEDRQ